MKENGSIYRITDLASEERPRERLESVGAQSLSHAELLAILLRVGVQGENAVQLAQRLLIKLGGLPGLHKASFIELSSFKGVGKAKAAQIKAAVEIGKRLSSLTLEDRPVIMGPADAAELVRYEMSALVQEHLRVINLDTRNRVLNIENIYIGSLNSSSVRIAELFKPAIQRNAASIILVHNHPSGDPSPSPEDINLTKMIVQAGKLLDISILDHIIIGHNNYLSLKDKGLGFF